MPRSTACGSPSLAPSQAVGSRIATLAHRGPRRPRLRLPRSRCACTARTWIGGAVATGRSSRS
eukprot:scaffold10136_cov58-Phaeocystis_antarctica.AAC.4